MPHEPLALPDILAGLPDEADYDAVHAALMATERGRRFLAEFADRNRNADTTMVVGAIARVEAAIRGEATAPAAAAVADDLLEIAAAIDRLEAAIVVGAAEVADVSAAIERVQDIAFMLHERSVEASLCDALDATVRDISRVSLHPDAAAGGADNPTALVRALAARLREMIARAIGPRGAGQPGGDDVVAAAPGVGLLEMTVDDGETFAQAVAALASSLPALEDAAESVSDVPPVATAAIPSRDEDERPRAEPESGQGTAALAAQAVSTDNVAAPARETEVAADVPVPASEPVLPSQAASEFSLSEAVLAQAFSDDHFSAATAAAEAPAREEMRREEALSEQPPNEDVQPAQNFSAAPVAGSEEDPDDLFEPQPVETPPDAAAVEATASETTDAPPPSEPPPVVPPPPVRAIPRPPSGDPLAAVRALSE
jgi:hypothetical protein